MFSNQKNKWNLGVKLNFENFEFWVVLISKSALVMTTVHQLQKLRLVLCIVFNPEFKFVYILYDRIGFGLEHVREKSIDQKVCILNLDNLNSFSHDQEWWHFVWLTIWFSSRIWSFGRSCWSNCCRCCSSYNKIELKLIQNW